VATRLAWCALQDFAHSGLDSTTLSKALTGRALGNTLPADPQYSFCYDIFLRESTSLCPVASSPLVEDIRFGVVFAIEWWSAARSTRFSEQASGQDASSSRTASPKVLHCACCSCCIPVRCPNRATWKEKGVGSGQPTLSVHYGEADDVRVIRTWAGKCWLVRQSLGV
jgi:hypothetical protein